jgi:hypothetical protein
MPAKKNDGLTKYQRHRLKDLDGYRAKKAAWARTAKQREKRRDYMREWREKNRARHNELARESHRRHYARLSPERKELRRFLSYGLTPEQHKELVERHGGRCGICKVDRMKNGRQLHIDHDHQTGQVRGLLCPRCNGLLGWLEIVGYEPIRAYLA